MPLLKTMPMYRLNATRALPVTITEGGHNFEIKFDQSVRRWIFLDHVQSEGAVEDDFGGFWEEFTFYGSTGRFVDWLRQNFYFSHEDYLLWTDQVVC